MARTYQLKTPTDAAIMYDAIAIEVTETIVIPEETKVTKTKITIKQVKDKIQEINERITELQDAKSELVSMLSSARLQADKVTTATSK